jgi:hypothetical protein
MLLKLTNWNSHKLGIAGVTYYRAIISDTLTSGPKKEFWCGSKKELNVTDLLGLGNIVSCTPQWMLLDVITGISGGVTGSNPKLLTMELTPYSNTFFMCA